MVSLTSCVLLTAYLIVFANAIELTFELPAKDRLCFYENIKVGEDTLLDFQVLEGGNTDVDMILKSPSGKVLYNDQQKTYDSVEWKTEEGGLYEWCFGNEFSAFTSKLVYFSLEVGDGPQLPNVDNSGALTMLEDSAVSIHESMRMVSEYQRHHRTKESANRSFAEDLNGRVMIWSVVEFAAILSVLFSQVFIVRSFFADKKNKKVPT